MVIKRIVDESKHNREDTPTTALLFQTALLSPEDDDDYRIHPDWEVRYGVVSGLSNHANEWAISGLITF